MTKSAKALLLGTKDYIIIAIALSIYALGFTTLILPHKVVIGGLTGISTIVYFLTGIPIAITNYGINLILLSIAYRIVGKQFVIRTIFGATILSIALGVFQPMFQPMIDGTVPPFITDPFMSILFGGIACGASIGLAFTSNGSTGGTDIIAAIVSKVSNVTIGRVILYCDLVIISSSILIFHKIDQAAYGFVVLFCVSFVTDMIINTNRQAIQFTIISQKWEQIANSINRNARRGCTVLDGMGWYSKKEVKVLMVMCRKIEAVTIFRIVKSIDRDAFVTQSHVNGVYGLGFDEYKLRLKRHHESGPTPSDDATPTTDSQTDNKNVAEKVADSK